MTELIQSAEVGSEEMNKSRLREAISTRRSATPADARLTRLLRVLVIDDDQDTVESMCRLIALWGHDFRRAYDTLAGLKLAATYHPDLILLDLGLPLMDGCRMAREIRLDPRLQSCFIVAVTGYDDDEQRECCRQAGIDLLLVKPVDAVVLETLLELEGYYINRPAK